MLQLEIRKDIDPKKFFKDEPYIIIYAFSVGDRHYFRFDDALNTPYERALTTLIYHTELDCNVDRKYITAHCQAFDAILCTQKFTTKELLKLQQLNSQLMERTVMPKETELMYKMAAVVYFDQTENPRKYEFKYGENKIRAWKKNLSLTDFFLSQPLTTLIPYLKNAGENLKQFSEMTQKVTAEHTANLLPLLSETQRTALLGK